MRVDEPAWHETASGVLERARRSHLEHDYTDVVVIGLRRDGGIDTLTYSGARDRYRLAGLIRVALDRFCGR